MKKKSEQRISIDATVHDVAEPVIIRSPDTGERLAEARSRLKLSVQEVAETLRLTEQNIVDIENRDYDRLFGVAYATGYVRAYAKLVGLNPDELIQNDSDLGLVEDVQDSISPQVPISVRTATSPRTSAASIFVRIVVIAAILAVVFLLWNNRADIFGFFSALLSGE